MARRRGRTWWWLGGTTAVVLLAVVALLAVQVGGRLGARAVSALSALAVVGALDGLLTAPEVHYVSELPEGATADVRVTRDDELLGTLSQERLTYGLLRVGGALYLRAPSTGLPDVTNPAEQSAVSDRWLAGGTVLDLTEPLGITPERFLRPQALAAQLAGALAAAPPVTPGTAPDGTRVLSTSTSLGVLSVTQDAPYRLVSLRPERMAAAATERPAVVPIAYRAGIDASYGGIEFPAELPSDAAGTVAGLRRAISELARAVDTDRHFDVQGDGEVTCSARSCGVEAVVADTGDVSQAVSGPMRAELDAVITVDDQPAGSCTGRGDVPIAGTVTISCISPDAGRVFASAVSRARATAQQRLAASGRDSISYEVPYSGQFFVVVPVLVDVAGLTLQVEQEAGAARPCCTNPAPRRLDRALVRELHAGGLGRSLFVQGESPDRLVHEAQDTPFVFEQPDGRVQFVVPDAGRPLGPDRATGRVSQSYTVVTEPDGQVVEAFPGLPVELGTPVVD